MTEAHSTRKRALTMLAFAAALLFAVGGLAACGDDDDPEEGETPAATEEPTGGAEEPADEDTGGDEAAGGDDGAAGGGGDAQAGSQLFAQNCEACHGPDGAGASAPSLEGASDAQAVETQIREGGGGMPPFEGQLDDQQIADLTAYVTEDIAGGG